jgi:hypothetical protein
MTTAACFHMLIATLKKPNTGDSTYITDWLVNTTSQPQALTCQTSTHLLLYHGNTSAISRCLCVVSRCLTPAMPSARCTGLFTPRAHVGEFKRCHQLADTSHAGCAANASRSQLYIAIGAAARCTGHASRKAHCDFHTVTTRVRLRDGCSRYALATPAARCTR